MIYKDTMRTLSPCSSITPCQVFGDGNQLERNRSFIRKGHNYQ
jgi:hypothetical protein